MSNRRNIAVASLAYSAKLFFSAHRMLFWGQSQPGCKMTSRGEIARISYGCGDRGGDIGANRLDRHEPPANLVFLRQRQDPLLENLKPAQCRGFARRYIRGPLEPSAADVRRPQPGALARELSRSPWRPLSQIRQDVREEHSRQPCVGGREGRGPGESSAYFAALLF